MNAPASSYFAGTPIILLGFSLFMATSLVVSLRSGKAAPATTRAMFWAVCAFKLGLAVLGVVLFFLAGRRA